MFVLVPRVFFSIFSTVLGVKQKSKSKALIVGCNDWDILPSRSGVVVVVPITRAFIISLFHRNCTPPKTCRGGKRVVCPKFFGSLIKIGRPRKDVTAPHIVRRFFSSRRCPFSAVNTFG